MQLTIPRSALVVACLATLATASTTAAQATVTPTTSRATAVTATSATLNGSLATGGVATPWEFGYVLASNPFSGSYTASQVTAAGQGTVNVSAAAAGLTPGTTYNFYLLAYTGTVGATTPLTQIPGKALTFTTKGPGAAVLARKKLTVTHGRVTVKIKCSSTLNCAGLLSIMAHGKFGGKRIPVSCGTASFTVKAGKKRTFTTGKVSGRCATLLANAIGNKIDAHLEAVFTTYQKTISKAVTLTLVP